MRFTVVASGDLADGDERWLDGATVVAADAGATSLDRLGHAPDRLVGDLDSISDELLARLAAAGVAIDRHPVDKDASDTELALEAAIDGGATEIVLLGATGGPRLDHALANVLLLADPALGDRDVRIVHGPTTVRVLRDGGRLELGGSAGDLVTLLPVGGDATGVRVDGVRWPLADATLRVGRSRGLSNEVVEPPASVSLERGTLLVVEHRTEGEPKP
ncbi:MAG TPA: thiamine diphosphokinase [Patescibacteria group bacterium]|nr:thiamine diphosphokinase [Patescibacteria group bacterium]